ncbi:hypothetical protein H6G81_18865 [Scytonema hofmannii FACHB-248]|uniref:Glycosyltransferase RgtA/B/C/D-like domain-containing protein n=2 Tax=Cyanophyceae TaxID=3028117 RepID=A0ABR8GTZ3_9CYAN|nr:hypothetical protein [Scytonema hofmannii FACHB-248]
MMKKRLYIHYLILIGAIALGAILRFWHLDLKPLWMDEVITAIFSLGKSYNDLPLGVVFPLERVQEIFTFQPKVSCAEIAENIARQSTHPPLFFCSMHAWLGWLSDDGQNLVLKLRELPALFGVGAIAAIYAVNLAFSKTSALTAAAVMAVSPFAVYLSQEARHYTLPMLLITLGLLGLMQIQQDIFLKQKVRFGVWFTWAIINSIALYVHYFCVLAFIAQIATLILLIYYPATAKSIKQIKHQIWFALILSISAVAISFIPWLMVTFSHFHRSETDWLNTRAHIAPFYQTLINWVLMVITLPVENQPLPIAIIFALLMLIFAIWVGRQIFLGLRVLWHTPTTHLATLTLLSFSGWVLLEFFAITYLLKKDITIVPRYNFVYYPSFCALIAASLTKSQNYKIKNQRIILIFLIVGVISSTFVVSNLVFEKPFKPEQVARNINQNPSVPLIVVMGYRDNQDVALGLSFALEVEKVRKINYNQKLDKFAFFKNSQELSLWQQLSQLPAPAISKMNLWVIAPGIKRRDYPPQIAVSQLNCIIDSTQHHRIGVPYQLYRCNDLKW